MDYIAYLHKDRDSDYGVSFPDFPGCVTAGRTLEEARQMAAEALELHIDGMIEDGDAIPEPSILDELAKDPALKGALPFLVHVEPKKKTVRINMTLSARELQMIDRLAAEAAMTRSAYLVQAAILGTVPAGSHPHRDLKVLKEVLTVHATGSPLEEVLLSEDVGFEDVGFEDVDSEVVLARRTQKRTAEVVLARRTQKRSHAAAAKRP